MHKFDRGEAPVDLQKLERNGVHWDQKFLKSDEHAQLGLDLFEKQDHYCAYCETRLSECKDGFIEHLERRSDNPRRTFDWNNMFFSCRHQDSCGNFKDGAKPKLVFSPEDIIDPAQEDPQDFFCYDMNGGIFPCDGEGAPRAQETIRVFNLDKSARLKNLRRQAADTVTACLSVDCSDEDITAFLESLGTCDCISVYYSLLGRKMA